MDKQSESDFDYTIEKFVADAIATFEQKQSTFNKTLQSKIKKLEESTVVLKTTQERICKELSEVKSNQDQINTSLKCLHNDFQELSAKVENIDPKSCIEKVLTAGIDALYVHEYNETGQTPLPTLQCSSTPQPGQIQKTRCYRSTPTPDEGKDIPLELRKELQWYLGPSSSNDKLNRYQRAFVRYFYVNNEGDGITNAVVGRCIREGVENKIWEEDFQPDGKDFVTYLKDSIGNFKKKTNKKEMKQATKRRLSDFLNQSRARLGMSSESFEIQSQQEDDNNPNPYQTEDGDMETNQ